MVFKYLESVYGVAGVNGVNTANMDNAYNENAVFGWSAT